MFYFIEEMLCLSLGRQIVVESALDFLSVLCFFLCYTCLCFFFSLFCMFCVSYELDLVLCLLFGGHLKILNLQIYDNYLGYLSICMI